MLFTRTIQIQLRHDEITASYQSSRYSVLKQGVKHLEPNLLSVDVHLSIGNVWLFIFLICVSLSDEHDLMDKKPSTVFN